MDFPGELTRDAICGPLSTAGEGSPLADMALNAGQTFNNSGALVANRAVYIPVIVGRAVTVYKMAWQNGATVSGNLDVGLYDWEGNQLVHSGSTAQAGTSAPQVADVADTTISPGTYFLAIAADNATGLFLTNTMGAAVALTGVRVQTTAFPLPTTATFALPSGNVPQLIAVTTGAVL